MNANQRKRLRYAQIDSDIDRWMSVTYLTVKKLYRYSIEKYQRAEHGAREMVHSKYHAGKGYMYLVRFTEQETETKLQDLMQPLRSDELRALYAAFIMALYANYHYKPEALRQCLAYMVNMHTSSRTTEDMNKEIGADNLKKIQETPV